MGSGALLIAASVIAAIAAKDDKPWVGVILAGVALALAPLFASIKLAGF